MPKLYQNMLVL